MSPQESESKVFENGSMSYCLEMGEEPSEPQEMRVKFLKMETRAGVWK